MRIFISIAMLFLVSINGFSEYFYCVTTNGFPYHVIPNTKMGYKIASEPLLVGASIKLGDYYGDYKITQNDITGNNFSAWGGYGTPYGYFIYPNEAKNMGKMQDLVKNIIDQCETLIQAANRPEHVFKEVRVSASAFSGVTAQIQVGYPLVYLNTPTVPDGQNIYRVTR